MNNILNTFNINKSSIEENEILNNNYVKNNNNEDITDLIIKKKKLIEMTNNLNKIEYIEILNIIQEDKCTYSNNSNGVFINLTNIEEKTIDKIFDFLKFTKQKKKELKEKENYLESFKKNINDNKVSNNIIQTTNDISDEKSVDSLSDNSDNLNYNDYLCFSSDDEDNKNVKK